MPEFIDRYGNKMEVDAPGVIKLFAGDTPPEGHLVCNGGAVSRAAYPELFAAIGTRYGAGDGTTTFNLPNTEDRFPRFAGGGLVVGEKQGDAIRDIAGNMAICDATFKYLLGASLSGAFSASQTTSGIGTLGAISGLLESPDILFNASNVVPTANENRPKAIALLACIRY